MQLTNTVNVIELVFTLICFPGMVFALRLAKDANKSVITFQEMLINSIREYSAITTLLMFTGIAGSEMIYVVIGCTLMALPNPNPYSAGILVIAALFIIDSVWKTFTLIMVDQRRRALLKKIQDAEKGFEAEHGS